LRNAFKTPSSSADPDVYLVKWGGARGSSAWRSSGTPKGPELCWRPTWSPFC